MHASLQAQREALATLCRRYGVARLAVFGSAARGDDFDSGASDVDLLVEFAPAAARSLETLLALEEEAAALLARPVDLVERQALEESGNYLRRRRILAEAETLFSA
jgi:predicted nucleotidyltransferase